MTENSATFNAYSRYYNILYKDKNYEEESNYVERLLTRHDIANGDLLEFGSGTGRHGHLLSTKGYKVHGIEISTEMVSQARQSAGFTCQVGDIRTINMNRTFDAVISLFHVLSYQTTNYDVNATFARAAEHLRTGGLFIVDFWYTPAVYYQIPSVRVKRISDGKTEITRIAEPEIYHNENRVDVNYSIYAYDVASSEIKEIKETHPMRHFSLPEIDMLASSHNLKLITAEEFLTGAPPSTNSWGVCAVLKKV